MKISDDKPRLPYKILVVDDEPSVHRLLSTYLRRNNYQVESCLDSQQVVKRIETFKPDLILLDMMMPQVDGISATRRIRNLVLMSYLPIIMLTAKREVKDMVAALEAGADDYIAKPFEFEELMARIKNMLRLKDLQDGVIKKTDELNDANQQISRLNHVLVQTNRQLQKKLYDFHNLFEMSYRVLGQLEFKTLVKQALLNILGTFATRNAVLLLADKNKPDTFEVVDARGFGDRTISHLQISRHHKLIHYLELVKKSFQIGNVSEEFKDVVPQLQELDIEVVSPLFRNDNIIGLLCLGANFKGEEYSEDNLETLGILTNMLAVAISNAQMYEHIKALSYTDGMTGLHNYRFFRLRIKEEIARSRRQGSRMSLLIMDVDSFKNYNDTLGHPAGDAVLRKVSSILQKSVRDNDIVARYGGEEFAIILPASDKEGALVLAERIRQSVETTEFHREDIQPNGRLTISIGVATFPDDAVNGKELIVCADKALYHAKNSGKNRVVEAQAIVETT